MKGIRNNRFLWLMLGLLWCCGARAQTATNAPATNAVDWLEGTWDVSYQDNALGLVHGQATLSIQNDGWINARYVVVDPRDGAVAEFAPFNIRYQSNVLTMDLFGKGPSTAMTVEGGAETPPAADTILVEAPEGTKLRATLRDANAETSVLAGSTGSNTRLRLERKGTKLEGQWLVSRQQLAGFQGARTGTRGSEVTVSPAPIGEVRTEVMTGPEVWESAILQVTNAFREAWIPSTTSNSVVTGTIKLRINGKNLPTMFGRKAEVVFADQSLHPDNENIIPSILLPLAVDRSAVPGPKSFIVKDPGTKRQTSAVWVFDWRRFNGLKSLCFERKTSDDHYEPTRVLYQGEQFYLEAEPESEEPGNSRLFALTSDAPEPIYFHLIRDRVERTKFRAGPFLLLDFTDAAPAGSVANPLLSVDQTSLITASIQRPLIVRASVKAILQAGIATAQLGETVDVAVANVGAPEGEDGPFPRALRTAKHYRTQYPDEDRYNIARFHPIGGYARTLVTEYDHAALILLHEEILEQVKKLRGLHIHELTEAERRDYQKRLIEASNRKEEHPLFHVQVSTPDGKETWPLNFAFYEKTLQESFGTNLVKRNEYLDRVLREGSAKLIDNLSKAAERLHDVDVSRPEELLKVVKPGYSSAVNPLMSRLVRRSTSADKNPAGVRWMPDQTGQAAVRGIADFMGAIEADEQLARFEWGWLAIVSTPLMPLSMFGYGGAVVAAADFVAFTAGFGNRANEAWDLMKQRDTARDLAPVIGYERYRALRGQLAEATPGLIVDGAMSLVGAAGLHAQVSTARALPSMQAMKNAVAQAMEYGLGRLSSAGKVDFACALDRAVQRAMTEGSGALTAIERNALKANYPKGIPEDVARKLKIAPDDPYFVLDAKAPTVIADAPTLRADAVTVRETPTLTADSPTRIEPPPGAESVRATPIPKVDAPNPVLERLFDEALVRARGGDVAARQKMDQIMFADKNWSAIAPEGKRAVLEAQELLNRMKQLDPALQAVDEFEATRRFTLFGAQTPKTTGPGVRWSTAEELVADCLARENLLPSAQTLANAAKISPEQAESILRQASQDFGGGRPGVPAEPSRPRVTDPNAETVNAPPRVPASEAPTPSPKELLGRDPRRMEIAEHLRQMGVEPKRAEYAGVVSGERPVDVQIAAAAAAVQEGVPAQRVMEHLKMPRERLEPLLEDYFRRYDPATDVQRHEILQRFFGDNATAIEPRVRPQAVNDPSK